MRRGFAGVRLFGCVAALALGLAACGDDGGSGSGGGAGSGGNGDGESFKIVMSNGFVSQWRTEMQNIATAMSQNNEPYKGNVDFEVVVSETSPTAQIQSINNIIAQQPDAILINALSPTALDPVVRKACAQDIVVIYFDQVGNEKCAYRVRNNEYKLFENNAEWLAETLKGKGRIIQDLGLPGSPVSQFGTQAAADVFKKYPGIEIVAKYEGNYTPGPSKQAVTNILTSTQDIDGVYGIAGVDGAAQAFEETNTPFVPMTNYGDMSVRLTNFIEANKSKGLDFSMAENAPTLGGQALHAAWLVLNDESVFDKEWGFTEGRDPKEVYIPSRAFNTNELPHIEGFEDTKYQELLDMSKGLPENALIPLSLEQSPVTPEQALGGSN